MKSSNLVSYKWYRAVCQSFATLAGEEVEEWFYTFIMALPGEIGSWIRKRVIPFKSLGESVRIRRGGWIMEPEQVTIGNHTSLNFHFIINGRGVVEIGNHVLIGPRVLIYSRNHEYKDCTIYISEQGAVAAKVVIEDDVWLCAGAIILPGVRVAKGTVVAAGAVVTKDTEPYSIVAGVPAVKIGERNEPEHRMHPRDAYTSPPLSGRV